MRYPDSIYNLRSDMDDERKFHANKPAKKSVMELFPVVSWE